MSSKVRPLGRKSGFTLVELLIVVAIIGVLSTIGVPTFRRMIQKSKKTEAQVNLGGLYTAEQAFQSEYGAFGNNLSRMGFLIDGAGNSLNYVVGFTSAVNCTPQVGGLGVATAATGVLPAVGDNLGAAVNTSFPTYYRSGVDTTSVQTRQNYIAPSLAGLNRIQAAGAGAAGNVLAAGCLVTNVTTVAPGLHNRFTAMAAGVIAPGFNKDGSGAGTPIDQWTITESRVLVNTIDGVR